MLLQLNILVTLKIMPSLFSIETTTDTKIHNNTTWYSKFPLQSSVFRHRLHHYLCTFTSDEQEPAYCACSNLHRRKWLLSPLLKCTTYCLTVLTSTVWSPETFSKHQWMSMGAISSAWRNSITHLCFIHNSMSDAILSDCSSVAVCHTAAKCNATLERRFNLCCHTTNIHFWWCGSTE